MNLYLNSRRLEGIIFDNMEFDFEELDSKTGRLETLTYLGQVYSCHSEMPLDESDYKNLYDIFYLLSYKDFENTGIKKRVTKANELLDKIRNNPSLVCKEIKKIIKKFL